MIFIRQHQAYDIPKTTQNDRQKTIALNLGARATAEPPSKRFDSLHELLERAIVTLVSALAPQVAR